MIDALVTSSASATSSWITTSTGAPGPIPAGSARARVCSGHNRAHLDWLDAVLDRHPGLVIENCASGGARTDYALLSRLQLQSTSDQQDFRRGAAIAAAAPAAVTPEQGAVWAYPQPDFTDDEIAFTLCSALLGRIHLSGHLDQMTDQQHALVAAAVDTYKRIRPDLAQAVPLWPLGLPGWTAPWLALGMRAPAATYVLAWHRTGLGEPGRFAAGGSSGGRGAAGRRSAIGRRPGRHRASGPPSSGRHGGAGDPLPA